MAPGGSGQSVRRLSVRPQQPLAFLRLAVATWAGDGSLVVLADERDARELIGPEQVTEVTDGTDEPGAATMAVRS